MRSGREGLNPVSCASSAAWPKFKNVTCRRSSSRRCGSCVAWASIPFKPGQSAELIRLREARKRRSPRATCPPTRARSQRTTSTNCAQTQRDTALDRFNVEDMPRRERSAKSRKKSSSPPSQDIAAVCTIVVFVSADHFRLSLFPRHRDEALRDRNTIRHPACPLPPGADSSLCRAASRR